MKYFFNYFNNGDTRLYKTNVKTLIIKPLTRLNGAVQNRISVHKELTLALIALPILIIASNGKFINLT